MINKTRSYLEDVNLLGVTMVYREEEQCHWALDWLYANCDKVLIMLDNHSKETEDFVIREYRDKYPDRTIMMYSTEPARDDKNLIHGQVKKRFKLRQHFIRDQVIQRIHEINRAWPVQLIVWPDSDETFNFHFHEYLTEFWGREEKWMSLGFVQPYESFDLITSQTMAPHGRVFKYSSEMSALPYKSRCAHLPYRNERGWKIRHLVCHMCWFDEKQRKRREFFDNFTFNHDNSVDCWKLPKDVREMTAGEIADYQFGPHATPAKHKGVLLSDYLLNNKNNGQST